MKKTLGQKITSLKYRLRGWITSRFGTSRTATACGHKTKLEGWIRVFDNPRYTYLKSMPLDKDGNPEHCLDCLGKMSIRCAECGEPIMIDEPVIAFYPAIGQKLHEGNHQFTSEDKRTVTLGCLRWECGESMFRNGFWQPPGVFEPVASPMDLLMSTDVPSMVIVSDLGDSKNTGTIHPV